MSQSTFVGAVLLIGFVLYLAAKDRLTVYENVLWGSKAQAAPSSGGDSTGGVAGAVGGAAELGAGIATGNPMGIVAGAEHLFSFL